MDSDDLAVVESDLNVAETDTANETDSVTCPDVCHSGGGEAWIWCYLVCVHAGNTIIVCNVTQR